MMDDEQGKSWKASCHRVLAIPPQILLPMLLDITRGDGFQATDGILTRIRSSQPPYGTGTEVSQLITMLLKTGGRCPAFLLVLNQTIGSSGMAKPVQAADQAAALRWRLQADALLARYVNIIGQQAASQGLTTLSTEFSMTTPGTQQELIELLARGYLGINVPVVSTAPNPHTVIFSRADPAVPGLETWGMIHCSQVTKKLCRIDVEAAGMLAGMANPERRRFLSGELGKRIRSELQPILQGAARGLNQASMDQLDMPF